MPAPVRIDIRVVARTECYDCSEHQFRTRADGKRDSLRLCPLVLRYAYENVGKTVPVLFRQWLEFG